MSDKTIKLRMFKGLGASLIENGQRMLNRAFNVKYTRELAADGLRNFLSGLGIDKISCADNRYYMIDWAVMKEIIEFDWTERKKYLTDVWDCDDYSNAFKSHLAEIYNINSVGLVRNAKVTIGDKTLYHRCNLILATEDNVLKAFVFEAQHDTWQEFKKDVPVVMGSWQYQLGNFDF